MNRMQHVHDALKVMRAVGEAWLTHEGERIRIRPLRPEMTEWQIVSETGERPEGISPDTTPIGCGHEPNLRGYWFPFYRAIIRAKTPGGVRFADVWWHEGRLHTDGTPTGRMRRGDDDIVLAIVVERHPRSAS